MTETNLDTAERDSYPANQPDEMPGTWDIDLTGLAETECLSAELLDVRAVQIQKILKRQLGIEVELSECRCYASYQAE